MSRVLYFYEYFNLTLTRTLKVKLLNNLNAKKNYLQQRKTLDRIFTKLIISTIKKKKNNYYKLKKEFMKLEFN